MCRIQGFTSTGLPESDGGFDVVDLGFLSGNQRGGRLKKNITLEDLVKCKDYTREAAAAELKVSVSTSRRRIQELGYNRWSEFQGSPSVRQDEDEVVLISVKYGENEQLFCLVDIEEESRFQKLQNLIEHDFDLQAGTYNIKWFLTTNNVNSRVFTISCDNSLKACFSLASKHQFNPISLTVENN